MGAYAIPISQLKAESSFAVSWQEISSIPSWFRKPLSLWILSKAFRIVNQSITNEMLGSLTASEALDLHQSFSELHAAGSRLLDRLESQYLLKNFLLDHFFINQMTEELTKLEDIIEALAWGGDDQLRAFIDGAVADIESTQRSLSA